MISSNNSKCFLLSVTADILLHRTVDSVLHACVLSKRILLRTQNLELAEIVSILTRVLHAFPTNRLSHYSCDGLHDGN